LALAAVIVLLRLPSDFSNLLSWSTAGGWKALPLQYSDQLADVAPWATADGTVAVAMLGDSTMRTQMLELCAKLGYRYRVDGKMVRSWSYGDPHRGNLASCESPQGQVPRIVFALHAPGGSIPSFSNTWEARVRRLEHDAQVDRFDVVYFGSSGLHTLHLLPAREWENARAEALEADVEAAALGIAAAGSCPIFYTTHWVCERKFHGTWGDTVERAGADPEFFEKQCRAAGHEASALCAGSAMTGAGSAAVAARERAAIARTEAASIDVHTMTRDQCWATRDGDGRHYPPLLHLQNAALLQEVGRCLAAQDEG